MTFKRGLHDYHKPIKLLEGTAQKLSYSRIFSFPLKNIQSMSGSRALNVSQACRSLDS